MTEALKQTIKEEILKMPIEAQQAINGFGWEKVTEDIGKRYSLSETEIGNFQAETAIILVGVENANSYSENIENNVRTTKDIAEKISEEVVEKIFRPIRKIIENNVKANMAHKEMTWKQSVDFILSGGDYLSLIDSDASGNSHHTEKTDSLLGAKSMQDIKDRLVN